MLDVAMLLLVVVFFALAVGHASLCHRLLAAPPNATEPLDDNLWTFGMAAAEGARTRASPRFDLIIFTYWREDPALFDSRYAFARHGLA